MANISFTKVELECLFNEFGMLIEACDSLNDEGLPRLDEKVIRSIYKKISNAKFPSVKSAEEQRCQNNQRFMTTFLGNSRWVGDE